MLSYVQGDSFRRSACEGLAHKLQAEKLAWGSNLNVDGDRLSLSSVSVANMGLVASLRAEGVNAEWVRADLWNRMFHCNKLSMESFALKLDADRPVKELPTDSEDSWLQRFLKGGVQLDAVECKDADFHCRFHKLDFQLLGCSVNAEPSRKNDSKAWTCNISTGKVRLPWSCLQDCSVKSATLSLAPEHAAVTDCRLTLSPGELRLRANGDSERKLWTADLRVNKANVARILSEDWKQRLHGELFGELKLRGSAAGLQKAAGRLSLQKGVLEGLPILSDLQFNGSRPYRSLELEKAESRISYPYSEPGLNIERAWLFDNIDVRAKDGLLLLRGHVIVGEDRSLCGSLRIGVPENVIKLLPAPVFSVLQGVLVSPEAQEGYYYLNMNLSGSLDEPQEDLSVRLKTLSGLLPAAAVKAAGTAAQGMAEGLLQTLLPSSGKRGDGKAANRAAEPSAGLPAPAEQEEPAAPETPADGSSVEGVLEDAVKAGKAVQNGIFSLF